MNSESSRDPLAQYAKVNSMMLDTYGEKCLDASYDNAVASLKNTSWDGSAAEGGNKPWVFCFYYCYYPWVTTECRTNKPT